MQLYEEYLGRHAINMPLVKHCAQGFLFFKRHADNGFHWHILQINWMPNTRGPGTYSIKLKRPRRNSTLGKNHPIAIDFEQIEDERVIAWDKYEDYFYKQIIGSSFFNPNHVVKDFKEITLTAWEMFIFSNDAYFSRNIRNFNDDLLFKTLDFNATINSRFNHYKNYIKNHLEMNGPFKSWIVDINSYQHSYCHWLVNIISNAI